MTSQRVWFERDECNSLDTYSLLVSHAFCFDVPYTHAMS